MLYNNAHEHAHTYKCTQLTDLEVSSSQQVKLHLEKNYENVQVAEAHVLPYFNILGYRSGYSLYYQILGFLHIWGKIYQNNSTSYDGYGYLLEVNLRNLVQIE